MRSKPVKLAQRLFHLAGVHLSRYPLRSEYENVLHDFLVGFEIGCVVDVGANVGHYGGMLRRIGYHGRIISFEPASATYQQLRERAMKHPPWDTHQMALGAEDAKREMKIFAGHENSTLSDVGAFGREWLPSALTESRYEEVSVRRLDSLLAEGALDLSVPTLLKVDTEGHDWSVIDGAGARLNDFAGLQTEMMSLPVWERTMPVAETMSRLATKGFEPVAFSVPNRARFSAIVVDGLFRNSRFAPNADRAPGMWNPEGMGLHPQLWQDGGSNAFRDDAGASWKA